MTEVHPPGADPPGPGPPAPSQEENPQPPTTRHAGIAPAMHAGIASPCGQTDTCKNITFANYVCWR